MTELKVLNGRIATEDDANAGRVVFYVPDSRSTPYRFHKDLPVTARFLSDTNGILPPGSEVTVVQAELTDVGQVLLGLMFGDGEEGLCQLEEVEIVDEHSTAGP